MFNDRTKLLFGEKMDIITNANVMIVGIGGVGGYVAECLARTGIEKLTLVDFDIVSETNINRQIIALNSTVGQSKVDAMKKRILDINPNCNVTAINKKLEAESLSEIIVDKYDFVIDAIDIVADKVNLIKYCYENNIKIVSAMGAGNRFSMPEFIVCDIFETKNDGLARVLRKKMRENQITSHTVVCAKEKAAIINSNKIASVMYQPAMCGLTISAYVINKLIEE